MAKEMTQQQHVAAIKEQLAIVVKKKFPTKELTKLTKMVDTALASGKFTPDEGTKLNEFVSGVLLRAK